MHPLFSPPSPSPYAHMHTHILNHPHLDSLALYGLNCYHLVKAGKGKNADGSEREILVLFKEAATDRVAFLMAASMVLLCFVAV